MKMCTVSFEGNLFGKKYTTISAIIQISGRLSIPWK